MKAPHGYAIGRVIREGRLHQGEGGVTLVEATIEMEDATKFDRGEYRDRVNICTMREDQLALVTLLKPGARVRVEGDIDATVHQDRFGRRIYTRVRITGSITLLEEALNQCDWGFTKNCPDEWSTNGQSWKAVREALGRPNPWER